MMPTILSHLKPLSPAAPAVPSFDSTIRLSLNPVQDTRATVDGAWWPRTRDAAAELPELVAAVDQRLGRVTLRVCLYLDVWDHIPRHFPARGRRVRVGWFRHPDPRVITLIFSAAEPIILLIIPPDAANAPAEATLAHPAQSAVRGHVEGTLTDIAVAHLPAASSPCGPDEDR